MMKESRFKIDEHLFLITYGFHGFDQTGFFIEQVRWKQTDRWVDMTELFKDELIDIDFEKEILKNLA